MSAKGTIIGNLGRDANTGSASNGNFRAFFNVASTRRFTNNAGERSETTTWIPCHFWGKRAEAVAPYLVKGKKVAVFGNLETKSDRDRDGNTIERLVLVVEDLELLSNGEAAQQTEQTNEVEFTNDLLDVPF